MCKPSFRAAVLLLAVLLLCFCLPSCVVRSDDGSVEPKQLVWAIGTSLPKAEDFFDGLPAGASVSYADEASLLSLQEGDNEVSLIYRPEKGRAQTLTTGLRLIHDTEPPVISGVQDIIAYIGEGISYRSGITLTDNCGGEITLTVDSSAVNTEQISEEEGYLIIYYATDHAGNTATAEARVHVYEQEITLDMLYASIDPIIAELGLYAMSKVEQVRAIWQFVHTDHAITYVDHSDKTSWIRAAYFALIDQQGDCFSFFALSKAFFERLGIENMDIQRTPGFTTDTHYWSLVNVAESGAPAQWYHYDSTRLRDVPYSGALLTDRQVDAFSRLRPNFYLYDRTQYPATSTVELTERPDLD